MIQGQFSYGTEQSLYTGLLGPSHSGLNVRREDWPKQYQCVCVSEGLKSK